MSNASPDRHGNDALRVLVVQSRRLGDVLMITPLLRALAGSRPALRVHVLVEPGSAPALAANPHVAAIVSATRHPLRVATRLRRTAYDTVIDAMGKSTSGLLALASRAPTRVGFAHARFPWCYTHRVHRNEARQYSALEKLALLKPLGLESDDCALDLPGDDDDRRRADLWWNDLGLAGEPAPIALAPVSRRADKRWPAERFARVCDLLVERTGRRLLLVHGPGEAPQAEAVVACATRRDACIHPAGVLPFAALPAAMARCAAYVGNDNGIRHVAVGLGLPTLAVFGRPSPVNWTPPGTTRHLSVGGQRDIRTIAISEVEPLVEAFASLVAAGRLGCP